MKTNVKTYRVWGYYDAEVVKREYGMKSQPYEIRVPNDLDDDLLANILERRLGDCISNDNRDYDDLNVYKIKYELISDSIPPADVMRLEGEKGLFDDSQDVQS